ncbi:MAG: serine hydrolase domain-containing protein [Planctomycetaceae bacterium]
MNPGIRLLVLFIAFSIAMRPAPGADDAVESETATQFRAWDRPDVPGGAVAIVRGREVLVARGFGSANLDAGVPITPTSLFELGSIGKSFTCAALAVLMDQGKVGADDDICKYVPEMPRRDPPILVRHLVRQEWFSGLLVCDATGGVGH